MPPESLTDWDESSTNYSDPLYRHQSMRPAQACAWATLLHCVGGTLALGLAIRQNPEEDQASKVKYVKPSETCELGFVQCLLNSYQFVAYSCIPLLKP